MNRRYFLLAAAAAAGCVRRPPGGPPAPPTPTDPDRRRIEAEKEAWLDHVGLIQRFRVEPGAVLTTPKPPADVLAAAPELKGLTKVAVRLHPRNSPGGPVDESRLGAQFLWPADEPWPTCEDHRIPYVPVLQLRDDDAPPQFAFQPGSDLLQLLWCPRDHDPGLVRPRVVWRKQAEVAAPHANHPPIDGAFPGYIPVYCRLFPERVTEFPPAALLPEAVRKKVAALDGYDALLSAAPGTKAGGYPWGATRDQVTACDRCRRPTDFLVGVGGPEWTDQSWKRWMPVEEQPKRSPDADRGYGMAHGLNLEAPVNVFVCRRCEGWPVRAVA
jgi:hypothetical protein